MDKDQEFLDALAEHGLVVSETEEGLMLGFSVSKLDELREIAEKNVDGTVIVLVKDIDDQPKPADSYQN